MRLLALFSLACIGAFGLTPKALAFSTLRHGPYSVSVEDEQGARLSSYQHRGETYVLGELGKRYQIRVRNHSGRRVEAVITVDGRDVVTGKPGDYRSARGYIIPAYGSVVVDGFRKSLGNVAAFRFTNLENSYTSRRGTPEHVGVIGLAFFPERRRVPPPSIARGRRHRKRSSSIPSAGSRAPEATSEFRGSGAGDLQADTSESHARDSASRSRRSSGGFAEMESDAFPSTERLGTEYAETRYSPVREVVFRRARPNRPARVFRVRYDGRDGLLARGIAVDGPVHAITCEYPHAFPQSRFAPPPR